MYEKKSMYNPRKCNSGSKLSGCIQREQSKVILVLSVNNSVMEVFEKTLIGGFSCVNTRQSFDTELFMPNHTEADYKKMNIDESFKAYKRDDLKVIYRIKLEDEECYTERRITTKILKTDENYQYGFAMKKPLPTGCMKEHPAPSWRKFNFLLENVNLEDKIGHLFIADIYFDVDNATEIEFMYNEILPPIIEKEKILEANERSLYQLLEPFSKTSQNKPKSYRCTAKSHVTLFPKKFIPLYLEDFRFLIKRYCWNH